jgi:cysteine desulfurase
MIYLDHNATTPICPEALAAMMPYLEDRFGNPSSSHPWGLQARAAVETARAQVAATIGADSHEIIFTSGGTEATNLAIRGLLATFGSPAKIVTTAIEHPATLATCEHMKTLGWNIELMAVDPFGIVRPDEINQKVDAQTKLITVMHANNETGTIQPVAACSEKGREMGAWIHSDASQTLGKIEVKVDKLDVDLLTIAGHKVAAPKGIGALYVREGTPLSPIFFGGGHERRLRPGTENVPYIVALGAACETASAGLATNRSSMLALRERLWSGLRSELPSLVRHGKPGNTLPNTLSLGFPGRRATDILANAGKVGASTGSACHEGTHRPSPVLCAMGLPENIALATVRLSLGRTTTEEEIDRAVRVLIDAYHKTARI